jgi:hypothetical protein
MPQHWQSVPGIDWPPSSQLMLVDLEEFGRRQSPVISLGRLDSAIIYAGSRLVFQEGDFFIGGKDMAGDWAPGQILHRHQGGELTYRLREAYYHCANGIIAAAVGYRGSGRIISPAPPGDGCATCHVGAGDSSAAEDSISVQVEATGWLRTSQPVRIGQSGWNFDLYVPFEDSAGGPDGFGRCGDGSNPNTQTAITTITFTSSQRTQISLSADGIGELYNAGFEVLDIAVDGVSMVSGSSVGGEIECGMGPLQFYPQSASITLPPGTHVIVYQADTGDSLFHAGAWQSASIRITRF